MARKTVTYLVDDFDGSDIPEGTTSTTFALNGTTWSIDLSPANAQKLEKALEPFIEKATRLASGSSAPRRRTSASASASGNSAQFLSAVREWAGANGYTVGERGRIKSEILDAYRAAH